MTELEEWPLCRLTVLCSPSMFFIWLATHMQTDGNANFLAITEAIV